MIVTSSWFTKIDECKYARIGISRGTPRGQLGYRMYRKLQPGPYLKLPDEAFTRRYYTEVLERLDPRQVVDELMALAGDRVPTLLCWERPENPNAWCHRGMVSAWLQQTIGLEIPELGMEQEGCGLHHPKLCAAAREYHAAIAKQQ